MKVKNFLIKFNESAKLLVLNWQIDFCKGQISSTLTLQPWYSLRNRLRPPIWWVAYIASCKIFQMLLLRRRIIVISPAVSNAGRKFQDFILRNVTLWNRRSPPSSTFLEHYALNLLKSIFKHHFSLSLLPSTYMPCMLHISLCEFKHLKIPFIPKLWSKCWVCYPFHSSKWLCLNN